MRTDMFLFRLCVSAAVVYQLDVVFAPAWDIVVHIIYENVCALSPQMYRYQWHKKSTYTHTHGPNELYIPLQHIDLAAVQLLLGNLWLCFQKISFDSLTVISVALARVHDSHALPRSLLLYIYTHYHAKRCMKISFKYTFQLIQVHRQRLSFAPSASVRGPKRWQSAVSLAPADEHWQRWLFGGVVMHMTACCCPPPIWSLHFQIQCKES